NPWRKTANPVSLLLLFLLFCLTGFGQTTGIPAGFTRNASVEGITEYQLPNGLRVLLFPDQTKQTATVNITYLVGSRHENYGETGMAHLLEHLMFKGSPRHTNVPQELSSHGARPNGTTWVDRTNYFETFSASDANLDWALDLESDRMVNSFIAKKDLDSEFTVVRNEMESGENSPFRVVWERVMGSAYEWHNYGKSTIGARSDVENVPIERLQAFYKRYYQPDNAVLLVAGKFDEAKTLGLIQKYFGSIPKPDRTLPPNYTVEPTQDGERVVTVRRTGDTQMLMAGYHVPPGSHPDAAAVAVMAEVLSSEPAGRLYKSLVESKKASSVFNLNMQTKEPGYLLFISEVRRDGSIDDARSTMTDTVENFANAAPTKEEVDRAKTAMLKDIDLALNDANRVGLEMSEWIAQGDWRLYFLMRDRIRKVTPEDVQAVAGKYLKSANRTVGMFIPTDKPDRAEVPFVKDADILAMVRDYKGDATIAQGEVFDPSPANIESRVKRTKIGGLDVALLPKENRGDSVVANLTLRFGDEKSLMNRADPAQFAGQLLDRGTSKHTRQQIQDEFDRLKAQVRIFGGPTNAGVSIETTRQNLPAAMRLVGEILREPAFPQTEFDQLKQEIMTQLESQKSEPTAIAFTELSQHFNIYPKGHPLYAGSMAETLAGIQAVTLDDVKKFYKDFYGASNGQLTVVGDFDEKEISAVAQDVFGGWKSPQPFARIKSEYRDIAPINKTFETPDKANAFFVARMNVKVRDDNPDYPALVLGNYMLGSSGLSSRLAARIRGREGLSYGVGSQFSASSLDESGSYFANAIYAPENGEKLEASFKDEIAKVLKEGFTPEEVETAKNGWLQSRQLSRAQDRELAGRMNSYLFFSRTIAWDADLESKVKTLTAAQINTAMQKYLAPDKITIIKAGDFAKAKEKKAGQ
ncbi:MAG TPA: pitrilysin family protein, partial [Pyrinomonadaceae bacterium]|nr:pitrilysin family protein [Pyrinomonadaceae bacterium]